MPKGSEAEEAGDTRNAGTIASAAQDRAVAADPKYVPEEEHTRCCNPTEESVVAPSTPGMGEPALKKNLLAVATDRCMATLARETLS